MQASVPDSSSGAYNQGGYRSSTYQMPMSMPPHAHSIPSSSMYQPNPTYPMTMPPAPSYAMNSHYQSYGYKRPSNWDYDYHSNKRPYYGSNQMAPREPQTKTCSRCNKELGHDDFAKRQWTKKDDERKCKDCVKDFLKEKHAGELASALSAVSEGSLTNAEKVSPSSTLTNDASVSTSGQPEATRRCSRCNEYCVWKQYTKTQWVSPAFTRKCRKCVEEEKIERKRQDQEEGIKALLMMAKDTDPVAAPSAIQKAPVAVPHIEELQGPEPVASAPNSEVHVAVTESQGILKPTSVSAVPPAAVKCDVVVKEEVKDDSFASTPKTEGAGTTSAIATKGLPARQVTVKYAHSDSTRKCSKCGKEQNWECFTKTQWLMSAMFRRCKECMSGEKEAAADSSSTYIDIESRKWMYEDADVPRMCTVCNLDREWIHFSKRQWIMHESERKCKQCVDNMLKPDSKE